MQESVKEEKVEEVKVKKIKDFSQKAKTEIRKAMKTLGYRVGDVTGAKEFEIDGEYSHAVFSTTDGCKITTAWDFVDGSDAKPVDYVLLERKTVAERRGRRPVVVDLEVQRKADWENRIKKKL